jgi:NO-binding membrane sensor protein with MHYT domain
MDVWLIAQGQLSIVNYTCTYNVGHVIGSVIIAIAATNVALALFFKMRQKWNDSFWKRVGCALILAAAVSGMHWTAVTGTSYTPIPGQLLQASTTWTVIVVSVIVRANYYKF